MRLSVQFKPYRELEMLRNDRSCIVVMDFAHILESRSPSLLFYGPTCIKRAAIAAVRGSPANRRSGDELSSLSSYEDALDDGPMGEEVQVDLKTDSTIACADETIQSAAVPPELPFTGHSMLTTVLLGKKCCVQVGNKDHSKYRAKVYALGGRLAKRVQDADLLVTPCAWGDQYKLARSFEIPVVGPGFIDALWEQRNSLDFELTDGVVEKFRLPVFARIKMYLYGFEAAGEDAEQLRQRAMANGAAIAGNVSCNGTYIVVVSRAGCSIEDLKVLHSELSAKSAMVYENWFYDSIAQGYALCEKHENYDARRVVASLMGSSASSVSGRSSPLGTRKRGADSPGVPPRTKKSMESMLLSPRVKELSCSDSSSGSSSPQIGAASPIRPNEITDQRHLVLIELRRTENNYVNILTFIMKMATTYLGDLDFDKKHQKGSHQVERSNSDRSDRGSEKASDRAVEKGSDRPSEKDRDEIITRFERQEIFKEIPNIIALHTTLLERMNDALEKVDFRNIAPIFHGEDACGLLPELETNSKTLKKRNTRKASLDKSGATTKDVVKENNIVATYKTFLNGLETIKDRVKTLLAENPRFAEFVRLVEEQPECNREKFLDLLIRPVQRWPSILILLKRYSDESERMAKALENSSKDSSVHEAKIRQEAADVRLGGQDAMRVHRFIEDSLRQMNDSKSQTLMICEALRIQNTIEDIPVRAMYWSKQYTLNYHCDATLVATSETLTQTSGQKLLRNVDVSCFLFSHGLEIARKKVNSKNNKTYKHVAFIHFDKIDTLLVNDEQDAFLRRLLEIVFREQRKELCVSASVSALPTSSSSKEGSSETDESETAPLPTEVTAENFEERVLLDLKDAQAKVTLMQKMDSTNKSPFHVERIVMTAASLDRKEGVRSDSLLLNLSHAHHGNTPVTQLARSLSNVSEMSTPKKLTRTFSNLIKKSLLGASSNKMARVETLSPHSPPGGAMQFSRSRHGVSISTTSLRPRLGAANSSAHQRSSMSLMSGELSSPENQPPSPLPSGGHATASSNQESTGQSLGDAVDDGAKPSAKRKKVEGGFALPVGRAPISPKWVRRSLSISRRAVSGNSKPERLDV
ncbi:protein ECT2-like [Tropilaelaps mercedesae]|uniref:Protein ECT2-like n=1 Tax=Tropilaelaps mercedesae TaxID=418985 RepID=A0A1V9XSY3_9ACAR|nr:protein ECT2-like [Tropilaelaps mercedesae]